MAGGAKETPRQRMIGMMYLVLTALLALQVSNAVLEKFIFIDESLRYSVTVSKDATDQVLKGVQAQIEKEGNNPKDLGILAQAQKAKDESRKMLDDMEALRESLIKETGGRDKETGELIDGKNYDNSMNYLIGVEGGAKGKAYELKEKLNSFAASMSKYSKNATITPLALDAKEIPMFAKNSDQKSKDFANLNFENTPLVAALAVLSEMQTKVARAESQVVAALTKDIGQVPIKLDKISAMVTADSRVVAAGTKYRAKLFLGASASNITPRMTSSKGGVKMEGGFGIIEFTAQAGAYDAEGNSKQTWEGSITIPSSNGDTTFRVKEEYIVAKPVIQVQSASVQALYLKCGNKLSVQVPALGVTYDPSFTATGAEVIRGSKKGEVVLVPSGANVAMTVSSGGNTIGVENFKVRLVPKPTLSVVGLNIKQGGACPASLTVKAISDESFKTFLPEDARYKVTKVEIIHVRGRRPVGAPKNGGETTNINDFRSNAREGDRLVIEVKEIQRMNFKGQTEVVTIPSDQSIFSYNITQ